MRPLILFRGETNPILVPFDADVRGTAEAETVQVAAGTDLNFAPGAGDRVEFAAEMAAYDFSASGNTLTIENTETGTTAALAINDATELAFADGTATAAIALKDGAATISVGGQAAEGGLDPAEVVKDASDISAIAGGSAGEDTQAPTLEDQTLTFDENVQAGSAIGRVDATDNAGGTGVAGFSLTGAGDASDFVTIGDDGRLTLTEAGAAHAGFTDAETAPNIFSLGVTAEDRAGNESLPATVTLKVGNVDDTAPSVAAEQTFSFSESTEAGERIGTLQASDNTGGSGISEFFLTGEAGNFVDVAADGTVTLSAAGANDPAFGDFDTTPNTFTATVTAEDNAGNVSAGRKVTFEVLQGDEIAPTIADNQPIFEFDPQSASAGQTLGTVQASDEGGSGLADFDLVGGSTDFANIADDGTLTLTQAGLDNASAFDVEVVAEDGDGNVSAPQTISVDASGGGFFG